MAMDPNSFANCHEVRVTDYHIALTADFAQQVLSGHVDLDVLVQQAGASSLVLDSRGLSIQSISLADDSKTALKFVLGEEKEPFGASLTISLPAGAHPKGTKLKIRVAYATSPSSTAIQWLPPSQTAGKQHPYLFTQCQAIHARSLLPCQDTPGNKCPYGAAITVPAPLVALMSAGATGHAAGPTANTVTYSFRQTVPMSSYLVALAIGALEKRDIGPRSSVWSEKEMVEAGAFEFAETEKFIAAAEAICGPYVWGRYDVLLLPPSFPYGGMENPCLTFVTPTLLAGDRSLANVVAHEVAHSWMGNLVSPVTWEHFWMNEGFTVFLERKILKALYGDQFSQMHAILGWNALRDSVDRYGKDHPFTVLNVKLQGVDPDDAFSSVPYEKGFNLLWYFQSLVGESLMNQLLKAHCEKFANGATTSDEWKAFFLNFMKSHGVADSVLAQIDWEAWYHKPGMPPVTPKFDTSLIDAATKLAADLVHHKRQPAADDTKGWTSTQVVVFLEQLHDAQKEVFEKAKAAGSTAEAVKQLADLLGRIDQQHHFTASKNAEIRHRWFTLCIHGEYEAAYGALIAFLKEQGRMKFVRPLYRDLFKTSAKGKELAVKTFQEHRHNYHNIAAKMVARDLELKD